MFTKLTTYKIPFQQDKNKIVPVFDVIRFASSVELIIVFEMYLVSVVGKLWELMKLCRARTNTYTHTHIICDKCNAPNSLTALAPNQTNSILNKEYFLYPTARIGDKRNAVSLSAHVIHTQICMKLWIILRANRMRKIRKSAEWNDNGNASGNSNSNVDKYVNVLCYTQKQFISICTHV